MSSVEAIAAKGDVTQLRRLLHFLQPYRGRVVIALLALLVASGSVLALGQGLRFVIDSGFGSGNPAMLNTALTTIARKPKRKPFPSVTKK